MRRALVLAVVFAVGSGSGCAADYPDAEHSPNGPGVTYEVLAWGLSSPRGLAVDVDGSVYVAEAGTGGSECVDPKAGKCFGTVGAVYRYTGLDSGSPVRSTVATGLLSTAIPRPDGAEVVGVDGIDFTDSGELVGVVGFSSPGLRSAFDTVTPTFVPSAEIAAAIDGQAGHVMRFGPNGVVRPIVDVGSTDYAWADANKDAAWAPNGQYPDSNPYAVLAEDDRMWVADAGANTVSEIVSEGAARIPRLIAYIPSPAKGTASVPTCLAKSGHWLYVGTLDFVGNLASPQPTSKVYRIDVNGIGASGADPFGSAELWAEGFNPITACAVINGQLYVSEYMTKASKYEFGAVVAVRIDRDGSAGSRRTMGTDLVHPGGIAALGTWIIVVNHSVLPGATTRNEPGGQIVRLLA